MNQILLGQEIASGSWTGRDTWRTTFANEIPLELQQDPRLCSAVGVVVLIPGEDSLPEVVLTKYRQGRGGADPRWEIPCGHVDPIDPELPDGDLESFEDAGRRETMEEAGAWLGELALFAVCEVTNPPNDKYPPLSFMIYYSASLDIRGAPTEVGHIAMNMTLARIGQLARMTEDEATATRQNRIELSEARIIRAAILAAGYDAALVDEAMGRLEE